MKQADRIIVPDAAAIETILDEHPELRVLWKHLSELPGAVINGVNLVYRVHYEAVAETQAGVRCQALDLLTFA
ncbi:MAG: hypothetical protein AB1510_08170 [Bacillota bacterium]